MESFDPKDYDDSAGKFFQLPPVAVKSVLQPASLAKAKQYAFYGDALLNVAVSTYIHDEFLEKEKMILEFASKLKNYYLSDDNLALILKTFFTADVTISPFWNNSTMGAIFKALIYLSCRYNKDEFIIERLKSLVLATITDDVVEQAKQEFAMSNTCANSLQQQYMNLSTAIELVPEFDWNSLHKPTNVLEVMWRSRSRKEYFQYYYVCCGKQTDKPPRNMILPDDHICNRYSWDNPFLCHTGKLVNSTSRSQGGGGVGSVLQGKVAHWTCCEEDAHAQGCISWNKFKKLCAKEGKTKAVWIREEAQQAVVMCDVLQLAPSKVFNDNDTTIFNLKDLNI